MPFDYALENKLLHEAPNLHMIFSDNVLCFQKLLNNYRSVFPLYTDHSCLHSLELIALCNELVGYNIEKINCDEIFVLFMAAYLHDTGMGISLSDYHEFSEQMPAVIQYQDENPDVAPEEIIRTFHHEFSGKYIEKYQILFDFPSEVHQWATVQVSRGHRKTDLYDEREYPEQIMLENGNVIHLPYLAALIRLSDELDIAVDRNIQFLFDSSSYDEKKGIVSFCKHLAIKKVLYYPDEIRAYADFSNKRIAPFLYSDFEKINKTFVQCVDVIERRTPFHMEQKKFTVYDCNTCEVVFSNGRFICRT